MDWVQRHSNGKLRDTRSPGFNPCCRGLGSKTATVIADEDGHWEFQSLLSWIGFKDQIGRHAGKVGHEVSILVVVDWVQRLHSTMTVDSDQLQVSILVVVDWVQRPGSLELDRDARQGFNPCCRGLGSKTRRAWSLRTPFCSFNPCCRGLGSKTSSDGPALRTAADKFQSLLSWIGFKDLLASLPSLIRC